MPATDDAANWRKRSDDHLVLQLQFLAHLFGEGRGAPTAARFMDEHLLRWLIAGPRCRPLRDTLMRVLNDTGVYCEELHLLADLLGRTCPTRDEMRACTEPVSVDVPMAFIPQRTALRCDSG